MFIIGGYGTAFYKHWRMNKKNLAFLTIFLPLLMMTGCANDVYFHRSKANKIVKGDYYKDKHIVLKNYILYNTQDNNNIITNNKPIPINEDSIMGVFVNSLEKTGLPIVNCLADGKNHIDEKYYKNIVIKIKKIDDDWIKEVGGNSIGADTLVMVPFIYLFNTINFTGYIGSSGVSSDEGFFVLTYFDLVVYVLEKNEIIYRKHISYKSEKVKTDFKNEAEALLPAPMIKQEHWDEIVKMAMEDYLKSMH